MILAPLRERDRNEAKVALRVVLRWKGMALAIHDEDLSRETVENSLWPAGNVEGGSTGIERSSSNEVDQARIATISSRRGDKPSATESQDSLPLVPPWWGTFNCNE